MRVITCASFYGTGSSAVTDFFSEFNDIYSLGDYEYRFLHEPDGIADLEYNIVENNHRHNTSDSIKRFMKYVESLKKMGYGGYDIFGKNYDILTQRYIDELVELKVHTWWDKDRKDKGRFFCFIDRVYSLLKRIFTGSLHTEKRFSILQKSEWGYYTTVSEEQFLAATRRYIDDLLACVNTDKAPFVMVDQMAPPTNTKRFARYFNDVKIVVVDRDPRDIYLLEKERWQWGIIPVKNVEDYVKWFKITRKYASGADEDPSKVLRIKFEDMIYKYEEMKEKLTSFVEISPDKHVLPFTCFDPAKSIKNTNLKKTVSGYEEDIKYIEENLKDYLYDFPDNFEIKK